MKVLLVLGTRAEAIKLAPVIRELRARRDGPTAAGPALSVRVCVTAQQWTTRSGRPDQAAPAPPEAP